MGITRVYTYAFALTGLVWLSACGNQAAFNSSQSPSFDSKALSNEVHYEHINESGEFVSHQIVSDPLKAEYEEGVWTASQKSASTQLGNGIWKNRVNIVFVGDGYTQSELSQYARDINASMSLVLRQEPFKSFADYFAFHRVDVVSGESGVSQDPKGKTRRTALGMNYYCQGIDRLLCVNVNRAMAEAQNAPAVDVVLAVANSDSYGGGGYKSPAVATFAAKNDQSVELALHELGHSFGGLIDEYDDSGTSANCNSFPNSASEDRTSMLARKSKWYRWLDLPDVGSFRGSCYSLNYYRPTDRSKMRALFYPYGPVNIEQFILKIYQKVRPIDSSTPPGTLSQHQKLQVTPMKPKGRSLQVKWSVNGQRKSSYDGKTSVDTSKLGLGRGTHSIAVTVTDTTTAVRDEDARSKYMTQTVSWTLRVP